MASLTPASAAAIARLRAYTPPPTQYFNVPLTRRAAVLILLFADKRGDLRVVLTMRASTMKSYAGHAALPGGKADALSETPFQTARREAWEEIGLPLSDDKLPKPFRVEHLCQLPANLARTELGVRPCVAFLHSTPDTTESATTTGGITDMATSSATSGTTTTTASGTTPPSVEDTLIPRLSAQEVAAVFTAPFHSFLKAADEEAQSAEPEAGIEAAGFPAKWYQGQWTDWHESRWRMHNFYVWVGGQRVARPKRKRVGKREWEEKKEGASGTSRSEASGEQDEEALDSQTRFRVFGMTARILVDAARVAYDEEPEFEHNSHFGDEEMIGRLLKMGRLSEVKKKGEVLTKEVLIEAAKL
ncbi:NUDIX-domain-containing protein [Saccharata proteae CBS 121410]|uniref:NUDIX-domain-containing protein n=1 Tax=Saccharata proteae CBS 121410 TaxID=1314787 RepID=A0A9P4HUN6_9PEZI|nr:NUDIX-domain-containing protein [Saccharata proteae CBS 121410]